MFWILVTQRGKIFGLHKRLQIPSLPRKLTALRSYEPHYICYTLHIEISSRVSCADTKLTLSFKGDILYSSTGVQRSAKNVRGTSKLYV